MSICREMWLPWVLAVVAVGVLHSLILPLDMENRRLQVCVTERSLEIARLKETLEDLKTERDLVVQRDPFVMERLVRQEFSLIEKLELVTAK